MTSPSAAPVPRARILKTRYESRRVTGPYSAATASTAKRARLLPTPDTGTSPMGRARRAGQLGNGHQSGQGLVAVAMALHPPPAGGGRRGAGKPSWQPRHPTRQRGWPARTRKRAAPPWPGAYKAAIRRWEHILGCPAPAPAEPGPGQRRASTTSRATLRLGVRRSLSRTGDGPGHAGTGTGLRRAVAQWLESYSRTSGSGSAPVARAMARMCPRA